jgi:hypothetical protein
MSIKELYIRSLGFLGEVHNSSHGELFIYKKSLSSQTSKLDFCIPFLFYTDLDSIFEYHLSEWNKNELEYFIAVGDDASYLIKAKEKPEKEAPLRKEILIDSFNYGLNTVGYEDVISQIPFSKESIDNSYFFDFVLKKRNEIKQEVDNHLLNNLVLLKTEMSQFDDNSENINGLILKCRNYSVSNSKKHFFDINCL